VANDQKVKWTEQELKDKLSEVQGQPGANKSSDLISDLSRFIASVPRQDQGRVDDTYFDGTFRATDMPIATAGSLCA
jgi:hypothetical protein